MKAMTIITEKIEPGICKFIGQDRKRYEARDNVRVLAYNPMIQKIRRPRVLRYGDEELSALI